MAAYSYGYRPGDRVYQGMTIAFDFSVEEIWVPFVGGATLVPAPGEQALIGEELADFLRDNAVTCMACSPTLLSSIESDVPALRLILVGGEACSQNLVARWCAPGAHHPQHLRPDGGDRHGDHGPARGRQAGHHRPAVAELFDRHPAILTGQL